MPGRPGGPALARRAALALMAVASCALRAGGLQVVEQPREDVVMALAAYIDKTDVGQLFLPFVNTLRGVGFRGKVILGLWEGTTDHSGYLQRAEVTPRYIRRAECRLRYPEPKSNYITRNVCTEDFPHLKLDNARWIYGRRWLQECSGCGGWVMFADFGDINFQQNPFDLLPPVDSVPPETVYLTEEMGPRADALGRPRGVSTSHWLVKAAVEQCYGREAGLNVSGKPMLNIASSFGTRAGMLRWLGRLEEEFEDVSHRRECDPVTICDQGVFNHLFYNRGAMPYATPKRYGEWIVNTMGLPCSNAVGFSPDVSMSDLVIIDERGLVWNEDGTLPAVLHQGKVCWKNYMIPFVNGPLGGAGNPSIYTSALSRMMANATFPDRRSGTVAGPA